MYECLDGVYRLAIFGHILFLAPQKFSDYIGLKFNDFLPKSNEDKNV